MSGNLRIGSILGIPIVVNASWLLTLGFIASMLALRVYPELLPPRSPYRHDIVIHWVMALSSGLAFFASIVLHELAHSVVARKQGIGVKNITLFVFGGVSQIAGEAKRPLHEFIMAVVGPLTSLVLAGVFFGLWNASGGNEDTPLSLVLEWLFLMNLVVAIFNMAPGFPMDGGRVLRSLIWGVSSSYMRATRFATLVGRGLGWGLMATGALAFLGLVDFLDAWSGAWLAILGLFLETSARQSWVQARVLDTLAGHKAEEIMASDIETARRQEQVRYLASRGGGRRFIFFVSDDDDSVVGVLTEKELPRTAGVLPATATAGDLMKQPNEVPVARPGDDAATMLQMMDSAGVWHLPVINEGRVIGVVARESILRLLARHLGMARPGPAAPQG